MKDGSGKEYTGNSDLNNYSHYYSSESYLINPDSENMEEKYGEDHISHVITFGTMAAKLAIKDVARVSRLPLDESNRLTKLIPDRPFTVKVDGEEKEMKPTLKNCVKYLPEMKQEFENGDPLVQDVLHYALKLEGCIRQTGIHACAMIIGRGDLTDYIPITMGTDKATGQDVWVSQYEGSYIEDVGMLKMDFLGLRTLSIIKECLALIKKRFGTDIDIEKIPIDDQKTYELYSRGDTKSVFQFESPGMKEWLQRLHPQRFEDLIAMNALYRPGPMDYIPDFVARKRGEQEIAYDLPAMEEYLEETYGVTVYQEQVMRISQKVAGFSKGKADKLRKAMGKKQIAVLEGLHDDFIKGAVERGHPTETLEKIWADWRKFASYAFNKSHATCYAWVSYQTGWLKAHYPAEFQAANLSNQLSNMSEIMEIMDDCRRSKIPVLSPDINESENHFTVNKEGAIRFGLGGMKGFGGNIVEAITTEREERGLFKDVYDFIERMAGIVNRKAFESLVYSGAMDSFGFSRSQYFMLGRTGRTARKTTCSPCSGTRRNSSRCSPSRRWRPRRRTSWRCSRKRRNWSACTSVPIRWISIALSWRPLPTVPWAVWPTRFRNARTSAPPPRSMWPD